MIQTYGVSGALMEYGWDEEAGGFGACDTEDLEDWNIEEMKILTNEYLNPKLLTGEEHYSQLKQRLKENEN